MKSRRNVPFSAFNFLVDFGSDYGPHAGFQELSGIEKLTGLNKATDVIMKRGVISAGAFNEWLDQIRKGHAGGHRTVTITQQDEKHQAIQKWKLLRARIIKHTSGPFNAKSSDVAMEELVLAYERLELE